MAATLPQRQQVVVATTGDTPDGQIRGLIPALYAVESTWDAQPAVQDAAVTVRVCTILITYYTDLIGRVMTEDERKTLQLRLDQLAAQRKAAQSTQDTESARLGGVGAFTINLDFLEPVAVE